MKTAYFDVVIIGAGPAGSVAGSMLARLGRSVLMVEKARFPRFSIGESLLPQCMEYLAAAGLESVVHEHAGDLGFQYKNGAAFAKNGQYTRFDFNDKFSAGPGTTYQVKRADFDKLLADGAAAQGVDVRYGQTVTDVSFTQSIHTLTIVDEQRGEWQVQTRFVLDASGFGRVLPRLLKLDKPSTQPTRKAVFTHVEDNISAPDFDRNKILISVHPKHQDIWYWLIPFADGTSSLGVVGLPEQITGAHDDLTLLQQYIAQSDNLSTLLGDANWSSAARSLADYSASVSSLHGRGFALLGNAGEFLDPVFSSGVTIALHSAWLAAPLVDRFLAGEAIDFEQTYATPLQTGINCFRTFVNAWYTGQFQTIIFAPQQQPPVRAMISSILAGYAWDTLNPYVAQPERRFRVLHELCAGQTT